MEFKKHQEQKKTIYTHLKLSPPPWKGAKLYSPSPKSPKVCNYNSPPRELGFTKIATIQCVFIGCVGNGKVFNYKKNEIMKLKKNVLFYLRKHVELTPAYRSLRCPGWPQAWHSPGTYVCRLWTKKRGLKRSKKDVQKCLCCKLHALLAIRIPAISDRKIW